MAELYFFFFPIRSNFEYLTLKRFVAFKLTSRRNNSFHDNFSVKYLFEKRLSFKTLDASK